MDTEVNVVATSSTEDAHTIPALVRAAAATFGDKPAYVADGVTTSFRELHERTRAVAQRYVAAGLEPGDRVLVWAPNSVAWVEAALAAMYVGAAMVPANTRYTAHEVADLVERTRARLVVVADGFLGKNQIADLTAAGIPRESQVVDVARLHELPAGEVTLEQVEARADAVSPDDVADILFTSGTTGRSKGALSAHHQTVGVGRVWGELGGVNADDRYLVISPFFHSFGYKVGIITGLTTGATLYPVPTFDVTAVMRLIETERITMIPGAPTIHQSLLNAPDRGDYDLSSLRLVVTGASVVPVVLIERMRSDLGIDHVVTAFGMTECVVATMARAEDPAELVATTCGRAVPGMEVRVDAPEGEAGELLMRGPWVMLGYLDDPEATAAAIDEDGWLHTGDVATMDAQGNIRITDRLKDMYINGGFNVYPAEVEQTLMRLEGVADVAVVGVPDERMGEVGKAFVVRTADDAGAALTAEGVVAYARERLANFKVPREVAFLDVLPRNLGGKVLKTELREQ
ncbi:acyl-CoA synthetase (AMP-forming)/AMP-acid ligase II [Nocardioides massiliensis]|uniref:Acyl-CoA synthetase (AMP-forming)/AMP-acid ligase II n=3 Tax=Nocardioides massiliensis TaxID=1325935 RepID=A0ABT9NS87_9ACTN|nr:FadD3 family acyl-CoA ligase [Nocardioides massiliensis]MDP9823171.1 acyl-CoA synthetase (AMP-forming)/AMP-acid ligase II [Nocardioides massiliensis]